MFAAGAPRAGRAFAVVGHRDAGKHLEEVSRSHPPGASRPGPDPRRARPARRLRAGQAAERDHARRDRPGSSTGRWRRSPARASPPIAAARTARTRRIALVRHSMRPRARRLRPTSSTHTTLASALLMEKARKDDAQEDQGAAPPPDYQIQHRKQRVGDPVRALQNATARQAACGFGSHGDRCGNPPRKLRLRGALPSRRAAGAHRLRCGGGRNPRAPRSRGKAPKAGPPPRWRARRRARSAAASILKQVPAMIRNPENSRAIDRPAVVNNAHPAIRLRP